MTRSMRCARPQGLIRALLDVNVLIALLDAGHIHHRLATDWLVAHLERGWASCPLTQNGCVWIFSNPASPAVHKSVRGLHEEIHP